MEIKNRFILFFTLFIVSISLVFGITGLIFIKQEIGLFINAPNKEFVSIMADKLLLKSFISFIGLILLITLVSVFLGLYLFKLISNSFLNTVHSLTGLASSRVSSNTEMTDVEVLKEYIDLLIDDQKKLKEFEKINSWKDGARLLIHEIKNPLTPLKLSLESMLLSENTQCEDDLSSAINSTKDIENILSNFKDLVNIEYGKVSLFNFNDFLNSFMIQLLTVYPQLTISDNRYSSRISIKSEMNLLKMLFNNLIKNGHEANPVGFGVNISEDESAVKIDFITQSRNIEDIDRCFVMGFSSKGTERGYGLFLCKQISEYLDINLSAENIDNNVTFCLKIKKEFI